VQYHNYAKSSINQWFPDGYWLVTYGNWLKHAQALRLNRVNRYRLNPHKVSVLRWFLAVIDFV
jgi:hypothetical protein